MRAVKNNIKKRSKNKELSNIKSLKQYNTYKKVSWGTLTKFSGRAPDKLLLFNLLLITHRHGQHITQKNQKLKEYRKTEDFFSLEK